MYINKLEKFYRRVIKVSDNIVGYYIDNPSYHRYVRLKKILTTLLDINENLVDNPYRSANYHSLSTARSILVKVGTMVYESKSEHVDGKPYKNRKVTIICGTEFLSLNPDKPV